MSLIVLVHHLDSVSGEIGDFIWPEEPGAELAGFEVFRDDVWGSETLIQRGATFLPTLKTGDLFVFPDEMDGFEKECTMLIEHAEEIVTEMRPPAVSVEGLRFRVGNFLKAIEKARQIDGVVYIG